MVLSVHLTSVIIYKLVILYKPGEETLLSFNHLRHIGHLLLESEPERKHQLIWKQ